jgi:PncC family amidohydrolase
MADDPEVGRLAADVGAVLRARSYQIGTAESCTGGLLAGALTGIAGSSDYVQGGIVAYSNAVKQALLGVQAATLETHGAVSEPTAREMAEGVCRALGTEVGVGITGIAGPGGGSAEKPVGLVYIGVATPAGTRVRRDIWAGDRSAVRAASVRAALELVLAALSG